MENNELIARFMGYEIPKQTHRKLNWIVYEGVFQAMQFHCSWNWLMPVVEKICRLKIGDGKEFVDYPNLRTFGMLNEETGEIMVRFNGFVLVQSDTLIQATYMAVVDFVKYWLESNKIKL